jgi:hypothetical protein
MEYMTQYDRPDVESPVFLFAFAGWADAAEAATNSLRHLVNRLGAKKFGEIDPEEFYDFIQTRPRMAFDLDRNRVITWPANELFFWKNSLD